MAFSFLQQPQDYTGVVGDTVQLSCEVENTESVFFEQGTTESPFVASDWLSVGGVTVTSTEIDITGTGGSRTATRAVNIAVVKPVEIVVAVTRVSGDVVEIDLASDSDGTSNNKIDWWHRQATNPSSSRLQLFVNNNGTSVTSDIFYGEDTPPLYEEYRASCTIDGTIVNATLECYNGGALVATYNTSVDNFNPNATYSPYCASYSYSVPHNIQYTYVKMHNNTSITYDLIKDGVPTGDTDTTSSLTKTFEIPNAQISDSGDYTIQANDTVTAILSDVATVEIAEEGSFFSFVDDNGDQFPIQAKDYTPEITVNFKLIETSSRKMVSIDRGSNTDRYATTLTIYGTSEYVGDFIRAITTLRDNSKSVIINSPKVRIFGDNVDHSIPIDTLVYNLGQQKTIKRNVQSVELSLLATDLTFISGGSLPSDLQCLQEVWSGYSQWNTSITETYNRNNYFVDREKDRYIFTGSYIMDIEQNKELMNFWKAQRGISFSTTDAQWGSVEMFGAEVGSGTHDVIMVNLDYTNISPTHRKVTVELMKV